MKKNKMTKILTVIIFISAMLFIVGCQTNNVMAADVNDIYIRNITDIDSTNIVGKVLGIVQAAGYVAATLVLTLKGIQYIWSSPDGKADIKKQFIPYFIGILILFSGGTAAGVIARVAYNS